MGQWGTGSGEDPEAIGEPHGQIGDSDRPQPGACQLERQRESVELGADGRDVQRIVILELERRIGCSGQRDEQAPGVGGSNGSKGSG